MKTSFYDLIDHMNETRKLAWKSMDESGIEREIALEEQIDDFVYRLCDLMTKQDQDQTEIKPGMFSEGLVLMISTCTLGPMFHEYYQLEDLDNTAAIDLFIAWQGMLTSLVGIADQLLFEKYGGNIDFPNSKGV